MNIEISKKKQLLESRAPFEPELRQAFRQQSLLDMIFSGLRLQGSKLTREDIKTILDGNVIREVTIQEHIIIDRYTAVYHEMTEMLHMGSVLNLRTLKRLYACMAGCSIEEIQYRKNTPVIHELSYMPPLPQEIPEQLEILMKWISVDKEEEKGSELLKAAHFHNRLVEVFPFDAGNRELARVALSFYMQSHGYPVFPFNFSESEYNEAIALYIKKEDIGPFYSGLERSLYNKLDWMVQMTEKENEY